MHPFHDTSSNLSVVFYQTGTDHPVLMCGHYCSIPPVPGISGWQIAPSYSPSVASFFQSGFSSAGAVVLCCLTVPHTSLVCCVISLAGTFNKECSFHSMEAHKHLWTMYHAEPDLWLLLVVGRQLVGHQCLQSSLTGLLKNLHSLAALLHGLISTQLEQVIATAGAGYQPAAALCCIVQDLWRLQLWMTSISDFSFMQQLLSNPHDACM